LRKKEQKEKTLKYALSDRHVGSQMTWGPLIMGFPKAIAIEPNGFQLPHNP
jgi:hypothetical protein